MKNQKTKKLLNWKQQLIIIIISALFLQINFVSKSFGQLPPMPEAAGLARYAEQPVSLFTGTGGTSIPLCQAKGQNLSIPISVSYHAGGIKVEQKASSVGLGWSLNAGGVITRTVFGRADEQSYFRQPAETKILLETETNPASLNYYEGFLLKNTIASGQIDTQPDLFYFNIGGKTGKFYFTPTQDIIVAPYQNLRISHLDDNLKGFVITDEMGVQYVFNEAEASISRTYPLTTYNEYGQIVETNETPYSTPYTSSWYLSYMKHPSGEIILFDYENYLQNYFVSREGDKHIIQSNSLDIYDAAVMRYGEGYKYGENGFYERPSHTTITTENCKRIKKISSKGAYITFSYSYGTDLPQYYGDYTQLDMITVFSLDEYNGYFQSKTLLRVAFEYDYYTSIDESNPNMNGNLIYTKMKQQKRLRLKKIYTLNNEQQSSGSYLFDYEGDLIPSMASYAQDYWGYYNGKGNSSTLTPSYTSPDGIYYPGADRNPDFEKAKMGILKRINYPSGGATEFIYEPHLSEDNIILSGGLRIKQIISKDEKGIIANQKKYEYNNGLIRKKNVFDYPVKELYYTTIGSSNYVYMSDFVVLSIKNLSHLGADNSFVAYRYVTETIGDGETKYKNVYEFHLQENPDLDPSVPLDPGLYQFPFPQSTNDHPLNGFLKKITNYEHRNGSFYKIKEIEKTYLVEPNRNFKQIKGFKIGYRIIAPKYAEVVPEGMMSDGYDSWTYSGYTLKIPWYLIGTDPFIFKYYFIKSYWVHLDEETEKIFPNHDLSQMLVKKTKYTYGNAYHTQPTEIESINSEGVKEIKKIKYAMDYEASKITDVQSLFIKNMQEKHVISIPIEQQLWKQKTGWSALLYKGNLTAFDPIFFRPILTYDTELEEPISDFNNEGYFMSDTQKYKPRVSSKYDAIGNLTEQISLDEGISKTYFWDRNRSSILAETTFAKENQVFHTSFEDGEGDNTAESKTGSSSKNNGFVKVISNLPNGNYQLSYWQKAGSEWVLQKTNVAVSTGTYTINLSGTVDEIRFHPVEALMTTYTYGVVGITSKTDGNYRTSYYEYDAFNRLILVRDENKNILQKYEYQNFNR